MRGRLQDLCETTGSVCPLSKWCEEDCRICVPSLEEVRGRLQDSCALSRRGARKTTGFVCPLEVVRGSLKGLCALSKWCEEDYRIRVPFVCPLSKWCEEDYRILSEQSCGEANSLLRQSFFVTGENEDASRRVGWRMVMWLDLINCTRSS